MSAEMDNLEAKVKNMENAADSAIVFIGGVADQIRDAAGDRAKSTQLAEELDAKATALANAIATPGPGGTVPPPSAMGRPVR